MRLPYTDGMNLLIVSIPDSGPETADRLWIRQASSRGSELMGYRINELLSKPLTAICPESVAEIWNASWRSWRLGGGATHTVRCRNQRGDIEPWEVTFSTMAGADVAVLLHDFKPHENRAPQRLTSASVEPEQEPPKNATVTIGGDKRVIEWNSQAEVLFGWSRLDALGQLFPDFLIAPVMLKNQTEKSQEVLQNEPETANAMVKIGDDKRVIEWNAQAEALFGLSPSEALGRPFPDFLLPQVPQKAVDHLELGQECSDQQALVAPTIVQEGRVETSSEIPAFLAKDAKDANFVDIRDDADSHDDNTIINDKPAPPLTEPATTAMTPPAQEAQDRIVADIQQSMLPSEKIENRNFEVCAYSAAQTLPGGTFLDYFSRREGVLQMTIMHSAAHSQDAALRMLEIRSVLRAHGNSPAQALAVLDEFLSATLAKQGFTIAMTYLEYNAHKQQLSYANAGHRPGLLCRRTKALCQQLTAEGSLIGASQKVVYEENMQHINSGDSVVLYSNALLAQKNSHGETFGLERLSALLNQCCRQSAHQILEVIVAESKRFIAADQLNGDVAALVFKRK